MFTLCLGDNGDYYKRLKNLLEETFEMNGGKKIMLISHSMGAPCTLRFLHKQTQEWKDKYIVAWTTISGFFFIISKRLISDCVQHPRLE